MSIEKKKKRKLTLELVLMTVISLIAGVFVAQLVEDISLQLMMQKIGSDDYYERQTQDCLDRLSNFITSNQVTEQNIELLASWAQKESNVYVVFYRDVEALFHIHTHRVPTTTSKQQELTIIGL